MTTKTKKTPKKEIFDFRTIKTFEDACKKVGIQPAEFSQFAFLPEGLQKALFAGYKLMIIYQAINNGWVPDWSNYSQLKYFPWFRVLSSGFGFSGSSYTYGSTYTDSGSHLCTDTIEKALYIAEQFEKEYVDYFLIQK